MHGRITPRTLMSPIRQQQSPLPLPTFPPEHRTSIDKTVVRDLPHPTNIYRPPDFCNSSPPVNPLKIITSNLGIFDVDSISSLFVDFSQIALHLFVVCCTSPHSLRVFPPVVEIFLITHPPSYSSQPTLTLPHLSIKSPYLYYGDPAPFCPPVIPVRCN